MIIVVARVLRVHAGHSPIARIHAVDEHGHEHKLEVPVESTQNVAAGQILVLQWSVHGPLDVVQDSSEIEIVPVEEAQLSTDSRPTAVSGVIEGASGTADGAAQLEALLGLRPGRLGGAGS